MLSLPITSDHYRSFFIVGFHPHRLVWDIDNHCEQMYMPDDNTTWSDRITQLSGAERLILHAALVRDDRALLISVLALSADDEVPLPSLIASVLDAVEHPVAARTDDPRDPRLGYWMGVPTP